jgi:hypothetical protein
VAGGARRKGLAGRNLARVNAVARPLGLKPRAFHLGDATRIDAAIKDVAVVSMSPVRYRLRRGQWRMRVSAIVFTTSTSREKSRSSRPSTVRDAEARREA